VHKVARVRKSILLSLEGLLNSHGIGYPASLSGGPPQKEEEREESRNLKIRKII
jgi:hypothetical protein